MKTKVIFYKELLDDEVNIIAVFPNESYKSDFDATVICYSHVGQHSGCAPEYLNECKLARCEEYQDLLTELISLGYVLEIVNHSLEKPLTI